MNNIRFNSFAPPAEFFEGDRQAAVDAAYVYTIVNNGPSVVLTDAKHADLVPFDVSNAAVSSRNWGTSPVQLQFKVKNQGAAASGAFSVSIIATSRSNTRQRYILGTSSQTPLALNTSRALQVSITPPASLPGGEYILSYQIIHQGPELLSSNNSAVFPGGSILRQFLPDASEGNDSIAAAGQNPAAFLVTAADIDSSLSGFDRTGSLDRNFHNSADIDFFAFDLASYAGFGSQLSIQHRRDESTNRQLYYPDGRPISVSAVNAEEGDTRTYTYDLSYLRPGRYYARVSRSSANTFGYSLSYRFPPRGLPADDPIKGTGPSNATPLTMNATEQRIDGTIHTSGYQNMYRFALADWAARGSYVAISGEFGIGDLGVTLLHPEGPIAVTPTVSGPDSAGVITKTLDISFLPPGEYYVLVRAEWTLGDLATYDHLADINRYTLKAKAPSLGLYRDAYESNDIRGNAKSTTGNVGGLLAPDWWKFGIPDRTRTPTIDSATDSDWYRVELRGWGQPGNVATLNLEQFTGSLRIRLTDANENILAERSVLGGAASAASVSLDDRPPGTYYINVTSNGGTGAYRLSGDYRGIEVDRNEGNDSPQQATSLDASPFGTTMLTVHRRNDDDWFAFTLNHPARIANYLSLELERNAANVVGEGRLVIELFDSNLRLISTSEPAGVNNSVYSSLYGLPKGAYFIRVRGYGAANARETNAYTLRYDLVATPRLPFILTPDGFSLTRLTNTPDDDVYPLISEGMVTWHSTTPGSIVSTLMRYDSTQPDARPTVIAGDVSFNYDFDEFDVDGDSVVFIKTIANNRNAFLFNGTQVTQLTTSGRVRGGVSIAGRRVAWIENDRIMLYDNGTVTEITDGTREVGQPQVNNDYVVWSEKVGGHWVIFQHDGVEARLISRTDVDNFLDNTTRPHRSTDGSSVTWTSSSGGNQSSIWVYDGISSREIFNGGMSFPPVIAGRIVAWQALGTSPIFDQTTGIWSLDPGDGPSGYNIFVFDGSVVRQLTQSNAALTPSIDKNGTVIWLEFVADTYELFAYSNGTTRQLTQNEVAELDYYSDRGQIVFNSPGAADRMDVYLLNIAPQLLSFDSAAVSVTEVTGGSVRQITVRRQNADLYKDLVVTLRSDNPARASVPSTIVIPAGSETVTFDLIIRDNNTLDAEEEFHIFGTADGFQFADVLVTISDAEELKVSLSSNPIVSEDTGIDSIAVWVTRTVTNIDQPQTIALSSSKPQFVQCPPLVTIPAGANAVKVMLTVIDDNIVNGSRDITIRAAAQGFADASVGLTVMDYESFGLDAGIAGGAIILSGTPVEASEGEEIELRVTRSVEQSILSAEVRFATDASAGRLQFPGSVSFSAGETSKLIRIPVIDNVTVDGDVLTTMIIQLDGFIESSVVLHLLDNDVQKIIVDQEIVTASVSALEAGIDLSFWLARSPAIDLSIQVFILGNALTADVDTFAIRATEWDLPQKIRLNSVPGMVIAGESTIVSLRLMNGAESLVVKEVAVVFSNGSPIFDGIPAVQTYTENAAARQLAPLGTVVVSDSTNFNTGSLTVQYTASGLSTDRLMIRNQGMGANQVGVDGSEVTFSGTVVGTYTGGTGTTPLVITFNAAASPSAVAWVLRNILYQNISDNPTDFDTRPSRTVNYVLTDGAGGTSVTFNQTLNITAVNDAPVISGITGFVNYVENGLPVVIASTATMVDLDSVNLATGNLTVAVTGNMQSTDRIGIKHTGTGEGQISVSGTTASYGGVDIGTFTGTTSLVVTLNGNATLPAVQALLRSLTFTSISENPSTLIRTVTVTLTDGDGGTSVPQSKTLNVTSVNDVPVRTAGVLTPIVVNEDSAANVAVSLGFTGLSYSPGGNGEESAQTLTYRITAIPSFLQLFKANGTTAVVVNGFVTAAELQGLKYKTVANGTGTGLIRWTVTDSGSGVAPNVNTLTESLSVTVLPVNDAPTRTVGTLPVITKAEDSANGTPVSLGLAALNYGPGGAADESTQTLSYRVTAIPATIQLFLAGGTTSVTAGTELSLAQLRGLVYRTVLNANGAGGILTFVVTDNGSGVAPNANSLTQSITVNITPVNDAPVLTETNNASYTENSAAVVVNPLITVTDIDSVRFASAIVRIMNPPPGQDVLGFVPNAAVTGNITGTFASGLLTLTSAGATATKDQWQAALRSVTYRNSSENPGLTPRTVTFTLNDGTATSVVLNSTVVIVPVNDAPVLSGTSTIPYAENGLAKAIHPTIVVTDVDNTRLASATVRITNYVSGQDVPGFVPVATSMGNIIGTFAADTGVLTLSSAGATATLAQWQIALRAVTYRNLSDDPTTTPRTVQYQVNDGGTVNSLSNLVTATVNITRVNDAPVITGFEGTTPWVIGTAAALVAPNTVITDADLSSPDFNTGVITVSISVGAQTTDRLELRHVGNNPGEIAVGTSTLSYGGVAIGTWSGGVGATGLKITLNAAADRAAVQAVLRSVTFRSTATAPVLTPRTLKASMTDGDGGTSNLPTKTVQVLRQPVGTLGDDQFTLTYSGDLIQIQRVTGGVTTSIGNYPINVPLILTGGGGLDSVRIVGTASADTVETQTNGVLWNNQSITWDTSVQRLQLDAGGGNDSFVVPIRPAGLNELTLIGNSGDDTYRFDGDVSLGSVVVDETLGGIDTLDLSPTSAPVIADLTLNAAQGITSSLTLTLQGTEALEHVVGGSGNDRLTGTSLSNRIDGGAGNDTILAGLGDDVLIGGDGSDSITGSGGDDQYRFAPVTSEFAETDTLVEISAGGADTLDFSQLPEILNVVVNLGSETSLATHTLRTVRTGAAGQAAQWENVTGGQGHDTLTGNAAGNILNGLGGNDTISGLGGNDTYRYLANTPQGSDRLAPTRFHWKAQHRMSR